MSKDCTIQDVFHRFYSSFESTHSISPAQRKAAYHIMNCKTGAFGVNVSVCEDCGCISVHYNSCRDRCCPMCQEFPKEKWVDARREDILDAPYFHVVFTVPEELNPIIYSNQKFLYAALYHAASDTLSELAADSKYLGTDIGYICILHTWGSTMNFHPHIHAIVLGGGLDVKNHWKDNGKDFFLPIKVISKTFRGKYMAELKQLWENDRLEFHGSAAPYKNYYTFKELLNTCYAKEWIPYCKKPFDGA
ncbi:MAG: transposase zinc-binding domain-containing protein, partial [Escherichia coli]|nr:transposase zinc-binding domain-containing protein [Escherichia coli]